MDAQQLVDGATAALREAFNMGWEVFWPLILGFALSGAVQAAASHKSMVRLLGGVQRSRVHSHEPLLRYGLGLGMD